MTTQIEGFSKLVIAVANGIAFGGACEIVEAAYLAIASEGARVLSAGPLVIASCDRGALLDRHKRQPNPVHTWASRARRRKRPGPI